RGPPPPPPAKPEPTTPRPPIRIERSGRPPHSSPGSLHDTSAAVRWPRQMPNPVMTRAVEALASGRHMSADHAAAVLHEVMEGRSSEVETAAFLVALRTKGETVDEVEGLARTMRELALPVKIDREPLVDTAGTG